MLCDSHDFQLCLILQQFGPVALVCILIKILLKQENKKGSAKELPVFMLKMEDCIRRGGSRRGRGPGFGRLGWLIEAPLLLQDKLCRQHCGGRLTGSWRGWCWSGMM